MKNPLENKKAAAKKADTRLIDPKYFVDVSIVCHPMTRKCMRGWKIAGILQYALMDRLNGLEDVFEKKYKARITFFHKSVYPPN